MSNQKRSAAPARRSAAVLSLFALAAFSLDAASAATRVPFQQFRSIECQNGTCAARFVDLPPNQALDVAHVWCQILAQGNVYNGVISSNPPPGSILVPFELAWFSVQGNTRFYNLKADPDMRVPLGAQLIAQVSYAGASVPTGSCSFTGFKITG